MSNDSNISSVYIQKVEHGVFSIIKHMYFSEVARILELAFDDKPL
jgi:hypothetical protein